MCRFICLFSTLNTENFRAASAYIVYLKIVSSVKVRLRRSHSGLLFHWGANKAMRGFSGHLRIFFSCCDDYKTAYFSGSNTAKPTMLCSRTTYNIKQPKQRLGITFIWKVSFVWEFPAYNLIMFCDQRILHVWSVVLMVNDPLLQRAHLSVSASVEGGSHFDWWEAKRVIP